jgi:hypothetical protein
MQTRSNNLARFFGLFSGLVIIESNVCLFLSQKVAEYEFDFFLYRLRKINMPLKDIIMHPLIHHAAGKLARTSFSPS